MIEWLASKRWVGEIRRTEFKFGIYCELQINDLADEKLRESVT